jgi:signal transduction histidine kinase
MLERSSQRIKELLTLVSDLLDIPRIETGQIIQEMKDISLKKLIETSVADLHDLAEQRQVKLKVEMPRTLPRIRGSAPRLQQVLTNLLNNAINYTPEGEVTVKVTRDDGEIKIEIMDTGIGIPAGDLEHIFEDFFRASNVEIKGTGLGLSIAKRIVETHGGRIWAESPCPETGCGSKFVFILPGKRSKRR